VHELLVQHRPFLVALGSALQVTGKLVAEQVVVVAAAHGVVAAVKPEGYLHLPPYEATLAAQA
jgi:hypothetical protein